MAPLDGVRVVDLTQLVAGPLAPMHLGDLGAEVVKIEHPDGGDTIRGYRQQVDGLSAQFAALNRNKHSVALDLSTDTWLAVMDEAGVPAGPVNDTLSVWEDSYTDHQDLLQHVAPDEESDAIPITRYPTNADNPIGDRRVDPQRLGAATERYLREVGYTEAEIDRLREEGIIERDWDGRCRYPAQRPSNASVRGHA